MGAPRCPFGPRASNVRSSPAWPNPARPPILRSRIRSRIRSRGTPSSRRRMSLTTCSATQGLCAKALSGPGEDWVSNTSDIIHAVSRAIYGIRFAGKQPLMGPLPNASASEAFLMTLRDLSLDFVASNGYSFRTKYTKKRAHREAFRGALLEHMAQLTGPLSRNNCITIAIILRTASIIFPVVAAQPFDALVSSVHARLGTKPATDAHEAARGALEAAGIPAKIAANFLEGAENMRKSRERKRTGNTRRS